MKKITIEFVKFEFEKEDYRLLTTEYINNRQKLYYICPKGHRNSIKWGKWKTGRRCPDCAKNRKLTIEFIRSEFEKEDYIFLAEEYINKKQKFDYICPEGHRHSTSWDGWNGGKRCPYCYGNAKPTIELIRSEFEKENYELLTGKYKNNRQKLKCICSENHEYYTTWKSWTKGIRCSHCAGNSKLTISFIEFEFKKEGYTLLTEKYINSGQKLEYICSNGHKHTMSWDSWRGEHRCPECAVINRTGAGHPNWKGGISKEPYCQD